MRPIVHQPVRLHLRWRQVVGDVNRDLGQIELACRKQSSVPGDYDAMCIDYNRLAPSELLNRRGDLVHRRGRDCPGIPRVGNDPLDWPLFDQHRASTLSLTVSAMAFIISGGTEFPSRSHCCAYVPVRMKSSGNAQMRRSSAIVNFRRSVASTTWK